MRYRKLDANGDYVFGDGLASFWIDVPEAPAQAAYTRLSLRLGEWMLDTTDGTDWNGKILGKYTESTRDVELKTRILGTPGVLDIAQFTSGRTPDRVYNVNVVLDTIYGQVRLAGPI